MLRIASIPGTSFFPVWGCLAFFLFAWPSKSQAEEEPRLNLRDTTLMQSDSLVFAPQTFNICLYSYDSKYEVVPDSGQSGTGRFLIRITARQNPVCATAAGYSGPIVVLRDLPLGRHRLLFTDSSDFKITIPDSIQIRTIETSNAIRSRKSGMVPFSKSGLAYYSVNGRIFQGRRFEPRDLVAWKNMIPE
jgi:hypothetical protein